MYARHVSLNLKPDTAAQFARTLEDEILPVLRKQSGFEDEITLLAPDAKSAIAISLWDRKESADAYSRDAYGQVLESLSKIVNGTPDVRAYEVANSTFHKIAVVG
ncbi:MAG TPA: hypothetical protein VFM14_09845 [Gemmatimonadales bacterium]|nr:hypothetical protein [Gemmatimonadales bacterium]